MGVPAFFRWLSRKYPSIVVNVNEEKAKVIDGVEIPVDPNEPNPCGVEFDNLYLDMNGIIHPCCHPEYKAAPKNEDEMMVAIFEYIDRLMRIIRPRRVLYMAIDGVAPRAKMNQQRSRRFRSAKDGAERVAEIDKIRTKLENEGLPVPPPKREDEHFDSNCITPGTPFMARLAESLRYYIAHRLTTEPQWKNLQVILSDANSPGEGEHKIMDFVRRQRASPEHDPNTHHILCGADADLIMLGLATHEINFTIIREEFIPNKQKPCDLCGQYGHELNDCQGLPRAELDDPADTPSGEANFIYIRLTVLREYLQRELRINNCPFEFDFERAVDDWVFMCFFVGNDFLPHLPSLEIRENAIDRLIDLYKKTCYRTGGFLTESGIVNLERVQVILSELGDMEDNIFKMRQDKDQHFKNRRKQQRRRNRAATAPAYALGGQFAPQAVGRNQRAEPMQNVRVEAKDARVKAANYDAARSMRAELEGGTGESRKRKKPEPEPVKPANSDSEEDAPDDVRLWEEGWKERYYQSKFEVSADNINFRKQVAAAYVEGLCWVLRYYYQGVPSWKWFYPYHYAPFASDFIDIGSQKVDFGEETKPFRPLEQLMGVFPAASRKHVPEPWGTLMLELESPIIDFYPDDFIVDLNGKKFAWQGVALLPFVDERRLLGALSTVYPKLTKDEEQRNVRGEDLVFVSCSSKAFPMLNAIYDNTENASSSWSPIDPKLTCGTSGLIAIDDKMVTPGDLYKSPLRACRDIDENNSISVAYRHPDFGSDYIFPACRLEGAKTPERTLKPEDKVGPYQPMTGFTRDRPRMHMSDAGRRMMNHHGGGNRGNRGGGDHRRHQSDRGSYNGYNGSGRGGYHQQQQQHYQQQQQGWNMQQQQMYPPNPYGSYGHQQQAFYQQQQYQAWQQQQHYAQQQGQNFYQQQRR